LDVLVKVLDIVSGDASDWHLPDFGRGDVEPDQSFILLRCGRGDAFAFVVQARFPLVPFPRHIPEVALVLALFKRHVLTWSKA
ncbi:MAG: hypothetical protein RL319_770, partial [Actinomycetota bacterium]